MRDRVGEGAVDERADKGEGARGRGGEDGVEGEGEGEGEARSESQSKGRVSVQLQCMAELLPCLSNVGIQRWYE